MRLTLWQLSLRVRDHEPDGSVWASEAEAYKAMADAAREHIDFLVDDLETDFDEMAEYAGVETTRETMTDEEAIEIAEDWDGEPWKAAVFEVSVEIPRARLQELLDG